MKKSKLWATLQALSLAILIDCTKGLHLADCSGDHDAVELTENTSGGQTVCEDIAQDQQIEWRLGATEEGTVQATCNSPNQPCQNFNSVFTAIRGSTSSTLTLGTNATRPGGATVGLSGLKVTCRPAVGSAVSCPIDIIYPPSSSKVSCSVSTTGWNIAVSCDVRKAYSTRNRYKCDVRLGSSTDSKGSSSYSSGSSSGYVSGTCNSSFPMPTSTGTYTYTVIVYPGVSTVSASPAVTVVRPSADPVVSCNGNDQNSYIPENTPLTCNCTASELGQPQGHLVVYRNNAQHASGNYGESSVQFGESSVSRAGNIVYKCVLDWATPDSQDRDTTFTLKVAYGPSSADLTNPPVHELDPTQNSTQLTLTCTAMEVNPSATYIWSGSQCVGTTQSSTCSFTPTKDDDGAVISCTAVNPISKVRKTSGNRTLTIQYPPSSEPEISGYSGGILYAGQTTTMTCTVTGGNPAVSSVNFTCDSKGQEVSGTSNNISVTTSRDHDGRNCTCSAKWKNKPSSWYPKTAAVTLHVYYPPDPPTIGHGQQSYPFLAGESPTLNCTLPTGPHSGNPPASLAFEGHTGSQGQREVIVTLPVLTSADHGRSVVCNATNSFTEHTGTGITGNLTLQVYYLSPIVTPLSSINCSTPANICEVKEGQHVHINCSAASNPSLANATWQQGSASSLDFIANRSTLLYHVCHVTTTTDSSDDRLPLTNSVTVTVLTTYAAQVSEFTADNSSIITVSEGDSVTMTCTAVGRPTPAMSIVKDNMPIKSRQKGQVTAEQQASLTHILDDVTCDATGQYRCDVDNDEGQANTTHLMVFVKCSPRVQKGTPKLISLNYKGGSISSVFPLTVYPTIHNGTLQYLGPVSNTAASRPARDTLYTVHCTVTQSSRPHLTTCNLTITGATQHDKGFYDLTLDNGVGQPITFQIKLDVNGTDSKAFPIAAAVGGGLAAGAVVAVLAAGIFIFRRKQRGKKKEHYKRAKNGRRRDTEEPEMITNELYGTASPQGDDDGEDETMIINTMYETSETVGAQVAARRQENTSAYEDVAHDGIRPMVTPGPPPAAASGPTETGLYAIVDKGRQGQPTASTSAAASDDTNVYAAVDKSKKKSALPQTAAKPEVKPKPGKKPKDKKKKKNSMKPDAPQSLEETEDTANLYGNIGTTSRTTPPGEDGTVYENHAFTGDEGAVGGSQVEATTAGGGSNEGSRTVNADGLVYTTVAFSESQRQKENDPFPGREKTEYAKIGFPVKDLADQE